jgi:hypothetical protein
MENPYADLINVLPNPSSSHTGQNRQYDNMPGLWLSEGLQYQAKIHIYL